jgi:hypothetical protein
VKVGDLVRVRGRSGLIINTEDHPRLGHVSGVLYNDGTFSKWESVCLEKIIPLQPGGYGIVPAKRLGGSDYGSTGEIPCCN